VAIHASTGIHSTGTEWGCSMNQMHHMGHRIQVYLDELGWSQVDLHRITCINLPTIQSIMAGDIKPTFAQVMIIINKINLHYPPERHWGIYHHITKPFNQSTEA
jgi:hypothetical protein